MTPALAATSVAAAICFAGRSGRPAARRLGLTPKCGRPPSAAATAAAIAAVAAVLPVMFGVPLAFGLAAGGTAAGARVAMARRRRRRLDRCRDDDVVTLCAALAAELRAGLPPSPALASAAGGLTALGGPLVRAAGAVGRGAHLGDELALVAADEACPRLAAVAAVCAVGEATGSAVADVLERVGRGLAADDSSAAELDALSAGPRATALVLAGLPALAVALGTALGLAPVSILLHSTLGLGLLLAAGLLDVLGLLWVARITAMALRG